jgi:hypothetical protein
VDPTITAAIIGGIVALSIAIVKSDFFQNLLPKYRKHKLIGDWKSSWGPMPKGPAEYKEDIQIKKQSRYEVSGTATLTKGGSKKWEVRGRYDGYFLQLYYFPASDAMDTDFLDYGCYFFKRHSSGKFIGYSTGFGSNEVDGDEEITADYHTLERKDI